MDNPTIEYNNSDKFDYSWTYKDKYYRYKQLDATGSIFIYAFEVAMDLKDAADVILDSTEIRDNR